MKKRLRDRLLAAGRRGEPKELTRGDCGSRRKLAAACRNVSRRAVVARRKRNFFMKNRTQGNCGPRKKLVAARRRMTHSTEVPRGKGDFVTKHSTRDNVEQETRKGQTSGKRRWKAPECKNGTRGRGLRELCSLFQFLKPIHSRQDSLEGDQLVGRPMPAHRTQI
jgi:hypothetical protein